MKRYLILDGNNHACMAASRAISLSKDGAPFEGIMRYLIPSMVNRLKRDFYGYELFACWDTYGGTKFRREIDPNYKATRDKSWIDFKVIEQSKDLYEELGFSNLCIPTCEGDDAIYSLAKALREREPDCIITLVTRDHDMVQVVQAGYATDIYDPQSKKRMSIPNYPITVFKALVGDSSDNIQGVKGIGPKTAVKVIEGTVKLTEEQTEVFNRCLRLVDASLNPRLEDNDNYVKNVYLPLIQKDN